jgi:hypothetical protein
MLALALVTSPLPAIAMPGDPITTEETLNLEAGKYVWRPELAEAGPLEIVISLSQQRAFVFRGGTLIGASTISSGREGYESPYGRFQILQKRRDHRSNRYDDAPMPYMQRLNWHGVALHGGKIPGYPASHGCIRLPMGFAKALYGATELGGLVYVTHDEITSPEHALELAAMGAEEPLKPDRDFAGGTDAPEELAANEG